MTLDDLLALLPDNTVGDISAADMRTIVTELWNQTAAAVAEGQSVEQSIGIWAASTNARIDALEQAGGGDRTFSGVWRLDNAVNGNPGDGEVCTDTGALVGAATLRVAPIDRNGTDFSNGLPQVTKVTVQDRDNANNWARWDVSGAVTTVAGDFVVPVTLTDSAGILTAGQNNDLVFVFSFPAAP